VVDAGTHAKGWSREQAIQYMIDTTVPLMVLEQLVDEWIARTRGSAS